MGNRKYEGISDKDLEKLTSIVVDIYKREEEKAKTVRRDRRLRNTKLLLKRYRELQIFDEDSIYDASQIDEDSIDIEELMDPFNDCDKAMTIKSIKGSALRTHIIIAHIKSMVDAYRITCERSSSFEMKRRFRIIYDLYINERAFTIEELADIEGVDRRTVYRDAKDAIKDLSLYFFGIDGLDP